MRVNEIEVNWNCRPLSKDCRVGVFESHMCRKNETATIIAIQCFSPLTCFYSLPRLQITVHRGRYASHIQYKEICIQKQLFRMVKHIHFWIFLKWQSFIIRWSILLSKLSPWAICFTNCALGYRHKAWEHFRNAYFFKISFKWVVHLYTKHIFRNNIMYLYVNNYFNCWLCKLQGWVI
jgi:hypothetical protein